MEGWRDGLSPWSPVLEGEKLYGRGGADDGYAAFAAVTALEAIQRSGGSHGRCFVVIEASEESGSPDLPAHVEALADRLGLIDLVLCLDSGCASYDTLWLTTSLRGLVDGTLTVTIVDRGVHSGSASGVVPSTFRVIRQLLDRVEDAASGRVLLPAANVEIPDHRSSEAKAMAASMGSAVEEWFPLVDGARPAVTDPVDALLARTWRPALSYVGADGLPATGKAGNVLRPATALKLSLRLPPTADPLAVRRELTTTLEGDPPYGATVRFDRSEAAPGWDAPDLAPWLRSALDRASHAAFGRPVQLMGEGGSIPFMGMLGQRFPRAQFVVTGVLGPGSNAHGPNEFLHLPFAERLTRAVAQVVDASTAEPVSQDS
jgi:acetylornithine deacetylase/succinyl-diaminopimelate desuccinylase-like protein